MLRAVLTSFLTVCLAAAHAAPAAGQETESSAHAEARKAYRELMDTRASTRKNRPPGVSVRQILDRIHRAQVAFAEAFGKTEPESWTDSADHDLLARGLALNGIHALEGGRAKDALVSFETLFLMLPKHAETKRVRASTYPTALVLSGDLRAAAEKLAGIPPLVDEKDRTDVHELHGEVLAILGDYEGARRAYRSAIADLEHVDGPVFERLGELGINTSGLLEARRKGLSTSLAQLARQPPRMKVIGAVRGSARSVQPAAGRVLVLNFCRSGISNPALSKALVELQ